MFYRSPHSSRVVETTFPMKLKVNMKVFLVFTFWDHVYWFRGLLTTPYSRFWERFTSPSGQALGFQLLGCPLVCPGGNTNFEQGRKRGLNVTS